MRANPMTQTKLRWQFIFDNDAFEPVFLENHAGINTWKEGNALNKYILHQSSADKNQITYLVRAVFFPFFWKIVLMKFDVFSSNFIKQISSKTICWEKRKHGFTWFLFGYCLHYFGEKSICSDSCWCLRGFQTVWVQVFKIGKK